MERIAAENAKEPAPSSPEPTVPKPDKIRDQTSGDTTRMLQGIPLFQRLRSALKHVQGWVHLDGSRRLPKVPPSTFLYQEGM